MEKKITKWIKCSQKITYYQEVELTKQELKILKNADELDICQHSSNDENREAFELIDGLINPQDIFESEQEFTDFELTDK